MALGNPDGRTPMERLGAAPPAPRPKREQDWYETTPARPAKDLSMAQTREGRHIDPIRTAIEQANNAVNVLTREALAGTPSGASITVARAAIVALDGVPVPGYLHDGWRKYLAAVRAAAAKAEGIGIEAKRGHEQAAIAKQRQLREDIKSTNPNSYAARAAEVLAVVRQDRRLLKAGA